MKGYQLIEVDFIDSLIKTTPREVHITIMHWLVNRLENDSSIQNYPVEIEVIIANYHGEYPCIALHYLDKSIGDIGSEIENKLIEYHKENLFLNFYEFTMNNQEMINQTTRTRPLPHSLGQNKRIRMQSLGL